MTRSPVVPPLITVVNLHHEGRLYHGVQRLDTREYLAGGVPEAPLWERSPRFALVSDDPCTAQRWAEEVRRCMREAALRARQDLAEVRT